MRRKRFRLGKMQIVIFSTTAIVTVLSLGLSRHFAKQVVTPPQYFDEPLKVLGFTLPTDTPGTITFSRGEDVSIPGKHSFVFDSETRMLRVGEVTKHSKDFVQRELLSGDLKNLRTGVSGRITGWWFSDPSELQSDYEQASFMSDHGRIPAWHFKSVTPANGHIAIHVHGRNAPRLETLRGVKVFLDEGIDSFVIGYRNDRDIPARGVTGYGLGYLEWRDVAQAIKHAVNLGYTKIFLVGWSMGATACVLAAQQSTERDRIVGMVLDSPAVDWPQILFHHAKIARAPRFVAEIASAVIENLPSLIGQKNAIPLSSLTAPNLARGLNVPTLVLASSGDTFVPWEGALEFAKANPKYVLLHRHSGGEHVKLWNHNPEEWESVVTEFIRATTR